MTGTPELFAAFSLGLFGSLHCVGMCAPLMLTAGGGWRSILAYQLGRLLTYALLGVLLGTLGWGARVVDWQAGLSISCGVLLVLVAVAGWRPERWLSGLPLLHRGQLVLRSAMARYLARSGSVARFGLGCCNGLLPCGLVYLAAVGAANTGGGAAGAMYMVAFGFGTFPLLLATLAGGRSLIAGRASQLLRYTPVLVAASGLLLVWRGFRAFLPLDFQQFQDHSFPIMCGG